MRPAIPPAPRRKHRLNWRASLRRPRLAIAAVATLGLLGLMASAASATLTVGNTSEPSSASPVPCPPGDLLIAKADSGYSYTIPSPGGEIRSWSINTHGATAATPVSLVVLRPSGTKSYTVVGLAPETLANPLPGGLIETFPLASPITVTDGEVLGLNSTVGTLVCAWGSSSLSGDTIAVVALGSSTTTPSLGATYEETLEAPELILDVSVGLEQSQDDGVTAAAMPSTITAGGIAEYAFTVSNAGPGDAPIAFSDAVPSGLTILSAVAGSGACTVAGQTVSCTISGLQAGSSAPVLIIVSAASAGSYADAASVSSTVLDPNLANNSASATLTVNAPAPTTTCKTVKLAGVTLSIAKLVIPALNCKVGQIKHATSKTVHKGLVISTSPGPGRTLTAGTAVSVTISSGKPKPKKKKKKG
jgi:uncharacterized repeat protein (TIGR01451 family)